MSLKDIYRMTHRNARPTRYGKWTIAPIKISTDAGIGIPLLPAYPKAK